MNDIFEIDQSALLRSVVPKRGKPYQHCCLPKAFQEVCHTIDECNGDPFTGEDLVGWTGLPSTQVFTAYAFLKERGIVETCRGRKTIAVPGMDVFLDGMIEWSVLDFRGELK